MLSVAWWTIGQPRASLASISRKKPSSPVLCGFVTQNRTTSRRRKRMPDPKMRLGFREPDVDTNMPFVDGSVKVEGFELEISNFRSPDTIDAWDGSFGGLMQSKGKGDHPYISIPAYPNRKFRLQYIFVNNASNIETPHDLEGKRVFVSGTAGVWARGALQNYYEVDFTKIRWVMSGSEVKGWAPGVTVEPPPR